MTFIESHAYDFGSALAALVWPFMRSRRRIAVDNIVKCGITADEGEAGKIAKRSWCHLAGHIFEALCVPRVINAENWREHLDTSGVPPETAKLLLDTPDTPILLVSSHHGVWEAATNLLSLVRPMIAIAKVQTNSLVARWMKKHHFRGSITIINKNHGFTGEAIHQWERECAALTLLMDQHTGGGALLKFLSRPARTYTTAARLAIRYGHPIVVGSFVRIGPYKYRLVGGMPVRFNREQDRDEAVQLLNDRLGEAIRQYPEQYLWVHKRWRDE